MWKVVLTFVLAATMLASAQTSSPAPGQHVINRTGPHGGNVTGQGSGVVVPGVGGSGSGSATVRGARGGTGSTTQSGSFFKGKGGFHKGSTTWNGHNTSGSSSNNATLKKGVLNSKSSLQVTNKKTGVSHGGTSTTQYTKGVGGTTTVDTNSGKVVTKTLPAKTP